MKSLYYMVGLLFMLLQGSLQSPIQETEDKSRGISKRNVQFERHAEGTYTNDVTQFLEEKAAKEFIDWLIKGKPKKLRLSRHADGTFTSDMSSYLEEKAAKEFVDWLIKGRPKRNFPDLSAEEMDRRHADGSFTSDFNKALDIKAAQEFLDWIINTPVKERDLLEEQ
ncbi:pro-glucagon isoform X3 [Rana temporaria]|uniref:pro-glucagon isoform X3 n=1 Tax=Rana temporaria TaxID=8407 RepID=UPI001AADBC5E|nr:pro-glucagon isoform X3 [Rana temporaria]